MKLIWICTGGIISEGAILIIPHEHSYNMGIRIEKNSRKKTCA